MNRSSGCARPRLRPDGRARARRRSLLLPLLLAAACAERPPEPERPALRDELLELGRADQEVRAQLNVRSAADSLLLKRMLEVDSASTQRLREIVSEHGWPGKSMVGEEAARAAFLIVQHSPAHDFQKQMLELVQQAAESGEAQRSDAAMLLDRVLTHEGKPQVYGTQFQIRDGRLLPYPIEDPARLDERRAAMRLAPMAEYLAVLRQTYDGPVDFDTTGMGRDSMAR